MDDIEKDIIYPLDILSKIEDPIYQPTIEEYCELWGIPYIESEDENPNDIPT